jgi:hypothetical protein
MFCSHSLQMHTLSQHTETSAPWSRHCDPGLCMQSFNYSVFLVCSGTFQWFSMLTPLLAKSHSVFLELDSSLPSCNLLLCNCQHVPIQLSCIAKYQSENIFSSVVILFFLCICVMHCEVRDVWHVYAPLNHNFHFFMLFII